MLTHGPNMDANPPDAAGIDTPEGLAAALRQLRRRLARQRNDAPLTYRELAATTGWAHGVIGDYFLGKTLPPTDRFDVLIGLLGATPAEQHRLATARDRVEELRRSRRGSTARLSSHRGRARPAVAPTQTIARLAGGIPELSTVESSAEVELAFVVIARRVVLATLTVVDIANRPWSHVVHPLWEHGNNGLTGWVFARSNRIRRRHVTHSSLVSLSYWHPTHDTAIAQCEANWADEPERMHAWKLALHTPPPVGYNPGAVWPAGVDSPDCALLRLRPWRLMSSSGASQAAGRAPAVLTL